MAEKWFITVVDGYDSESNLGDDEAVSNNSIIDSQTKELQKAIAGFAGGAPKPDWFVEEDYTTNLKNITDWVNNAKPGEWTNMKWIYWIPYANPIDSRLVVHSVLIFCTNKADNPERS